MRHRHTPKPEDELVGFRGGPMPAWAVEWNSKQHMDGFDELPKTLRDLINYAPSPEWGAKPTADLVAPTGPYGQYMDLDWDEVQRKIDAKLREAKK